MRISRTENLICWCWLLVGLLSTVTMAKSACAAEDLASKEKQLQLIADFADRMCKNIPLKGSGKKLELSGRINVEIKGLIKKLVDLGLDGAAKYEKPEYEGVLQEDLANALKTSTDCKLEVFRALKDKMLRQGPEDDDPLYIFNVSGGLDHLYESFRATNPPPDVAELLLRLYMLGALSKEVARHGKDYKWYKTPKSEYIDLELMARPSSVYFDKEGRKLRTIHIESRRAGGIWKKEQDEIYVWEEGDWRKLP